MLKFIREHLASPTISKVLAWLSPMVIAAAAWAKDWAIGVAKNLSPEVVALLIVLSIAIILALVAWVVFLIPSFKFVHKYQFYQHRTNGLFYCPTCRERKPLSPLRREVSGWRCPFKDCLKFYKDPDYQKPEEPPQPPRPTGPNAWMAR